MPKNSTQLFECSESVGVPGNQDSYTMLFEVHGKIKSFPQLSFSVNSTFWPGCLYFWWSVWVEYRTLGEKSEEYSVPHDWILVRKLYEACESSAILCRPLILRILDFSISGDHQKLMYFWRFQISSGNQQKRNISANGIFSRLRTCIKVHQKPYDTAQCSYTTHPHFGVRPITSIICQNHQKYIVSPNCASDGSNGTIFCTIINDGTLEYQK